MRLYRNASCGAFTRAQQLAGLGFRFRPSLNPCPVLTSFSAGADVLLGAGVKDLDEEQFPKSDVNEFGTYCSPLDALSSNLLRA